MTANENKPALPPLPPPNLAAILEEAASNPHYQRSEYARWMKEASDALHAITKWAEEQSLIDQAAPVEIEITPAMVEAMELADKAADYTGINIPKEARYAAIFRAAIERQPTHESQPNKLHADIINLPHRMPITKYKVGTEAFNAYKEGHRDARHAAAELALASRQPVREPLTCDQIEDAFPETGHSVADDGQITLAAAWLHEFARAIERAHGIAAAKDDA